MENMSDRRIVSSLVSKDTRRIDHKNSSIDLMIRGSPPDGGERGSAGSVAKPMPWGIGGGDRAAERSMRWNDAGAKGVGDRNSFVLGENKPPPESGASRTNTWV
jgi:hypothetical protein